MALNLNWGPGIVILLLVVATEAILDSQSSLDNDNCSLQSESGRCNASWWLSDQYHHCVQLEPATCADGSVIVTEGSICVYTVDDVLFSCSRGQWVTQDYVPAYHREKRNLGIVLGVLGAAVGIADLICHFVCSKDTETVYVTSKPPEIHNCPNDTQKNADKGSTTTLITWTPPNATDPDPPAGGSSNVNVDQRNGPSPNTFVEEGQYAVVYTARDPGGASDYCWFTVTVKVLRCEDPLFTRYSTRTCGRPANIYGSRCTYTCDPGYMMQGGASSSVIECQEDQTWDKDFSICQPVSCGDPGNVTDGTYDCPGGHVFSELCYVTCKPGYRQISGAPFIRCLEDKSWTPTQPCIDVESPKFPNGCSPNLALYSGPLQAPTEVNWTDPVVTDNSPLPVTLTSDIGKGSLLGPGFHVVRVTATDAAGNSVSCNFVVTVETKTCFPPIVPSNGHMTCTSGYVEGSQCTTACSLGYDLEGNSTLTCLATKSWDYLEPYCQAVLCDDPPQVDNGYFDCSTGYQYMAACSFHCDPTFSLRGYPNIQCQANKTWSQAGFCQDIEGPKFPNGCPGNVGTFASRLGLSTNVTWPAPDVTDNSGSNVTLGSSVTPGATFMLGVTPVTYTATDVNGNANTCRFTVTVTTLTCGAPNASSSYLLYQCPDGYVHGAVCSASCSYGFPVTGSKNVSCERDDSSYPPTMTWTPGAAGAPTCIETKCLNLSAPVNGALGCFQGNFGKECQMSCQAAWDVPAFTDGRFVCPNDKGIWTPSTVPNCTVRFLPGRVRASSDLYYFTSSCNVSLDQIRQSFIDRMRSSQWSSACAGTTSCVAENIEVTCGSLSGRRKRREADAFSRQRRQSNNFYLRATFDFVIDYEESGSQPDVAYTRYMNIKDDIYARLQEDAKNGHFNLEPDLIADESSVGYPQVSTDCPPGTYFKQTTTTTRFSCVGCSKGYYLIDPKTGCGKCPVGNYSALNTASSCTACPVGWSTAAAGSTSVNDCAELCTPGHFSQRGFVPCQPCPPGTYQSRVKGMTCDLCPAGTWTNGGASGLDSCFAVDAYLDNGSGLLAQSGPSLSGVTLTSYISLTNESLATLNFAFSGSGYNAVSMHMYSVQNMSTPVPQNSSSSRSVWCQTSAWCRVDLTLDPGTGTTTLYFQTAAILSVTAAPSASVRNAAVTVIATNGTVVVSGVYGQGSLQAVGGSVLNVSQCQGRSASNVLTWTPEARTLHGPSLCDAVDDCLSSPCSTHGTCSNRQDGFLCHCQDGWSGVTCHDPPSPCYQHRCQNGATCVTNSSGGANYSCQCPAQFSGLYCDLVKVHGGWGEWSVWENCSAPCEGREERRRLCNNPVADNGGEDCMGVNKQTQLCGPLHCPVSGLWGAWAGWSACTLSCGSGSRSRTRQCDSPGPQYGGNDCDDVGVDTEACNNITCPVHGNWGEWGDLTPCSITCGGGGVRYRLRSCDNPEPVNGGRPCSGSANETQACGQQSCPDCNRSRLRRSVGTLLVCVEETSPKLITCNLTCAPGYTTVRSFTEYKCGETTGYLWNGQRNYTDLVILPDCTVPTTASSAVVDQTVAMNVGCDVDANQVRASVMDNMQQQLPCVASGCQMSVSTGCQNAAQSPAGLGTRRKRAAGALTVRFQLTMNLGNLSTIDGNNTAAVQHYTQLLSVADQSAAMVAENQTRSLFLVLVNGVQLQPDYTVNYTAKLVCPPGSTSSYWYCVQCPAGSMEENGQCVLCPVGHYQDETGKTNCKDCPVGMAYYFIGADDMSLCYDSFTDKVNPGAGGERDGDHANVGLIVGVTLAAAAVLVAVGVVVVVIVKKKATYSQWVEMHSRPTSAHSGKVHPAAEDKQALERPVSVLNDWDFTLLTSRLETALVQDCSDAKGP